MPGHADDLARRTAIRRGDALVRLVESARRAVRRRAPGDRGKNQTLAAAEATPARAQTALAQARAAFYPQISAFGNAGARRPRCAATRDAEPGLQPVLADRRELPPDVSGTRRGRRGRPAENQRYQLGAASSRSLPATVSQALAIAGSTRIATTEEISTTTRRTWTWYVPSSTPAGRADVLTAEAQLMNRAVAAPLRQQLARARRPVDPAGRFPAEWSPCRSSI
jgi:hypothetical protein